MKSGSCRAGRDYVEAAYPNPDRIGCPGRKRLEALARHKSPLADDINDIEHVVNCSPCFVEYHTIRRAGRRRRAAIVGTLLGSVLVILAFSAIFLVRRLPRTCSPSKQASRNRPARDSEGY